MIMPLSLVKSKTSLEVVSYYGPTPPTQPKPKLFPFIGAILAHTDPMIALSSIAKSKPSLEVVWQRHCHKLTLQVENTFQRGTEEALLKTYSS